MSDLNVVAVSCRIASDVDNKGKYGVMKCVSDVGKDERLWFNVKMFGRTLELMSEYGKKGKPLYITGRLSNSGKELEVVAERIDFVSSRKLENNDEGTRTQESKPESKERPF